MSSLFRFLVVALALAAAPFDLTAASKAEPARLSPEDQTDLGRIEEYLNGIRTMRSRFFQVAPSGAHAEGNLFLSRPGKLRIAYDPPVPILIVAHDRTVGYYDRELGQAQYFGSDQTPAGVLLRDKIRLAGGDLAVTRFERSPGALRLTLAQTADPGQGSIALVFSDRPLILRKWVVIDTQGQTTEVALMAPEFGVALEPKLFLFDDMVEKKTPQN
ncbi:MAG: outer membrane lipoprotein carrier protein LolA [Rhodospirillales bacterium]|nr:outer membrane lipoprotein carrier protein LolA [Rhodospirillales bacterium]MSP81129.1 outer membrane lipoprotein carrier protein LolA [Rhodospirillales bacterium]